MSDLHFENHGTVFTCTPQTEVGKRWLDSLPSEGWQWLGPSLGVDRRYVRDLADAAVADGLTVD